MRIVKGLNYWFVVTGLNYWFVVIPDLRIIDCRVTDGSLK